MALCFASVPWRKPLFIVGFFGFREHGFSSAQRSAVTLESVCPLWPHAHCWALQGHLSATAHCAPASSASLWLVGFLFHKQKVTWKTLLGPQAHSELWEAAGRQQVPQWWNRASWIAIAAPAPSASLPAHTCAFVADWHSSCGRLRTPLAKRSHCCCLEVHSWRLESCAV